MTYLIIAIELLMFIAISTAACWKRLPNLQQPKEKLHEYHVEII